jgi:hypothetical protein
METKETSIKVLEALAQGLNPITGEVFPKDSPYQDVQIVRALFDALEALKKVKPKKTTPINQGGKWTNELNELLINQFNENMPISQIANLHGRSSGAIKSRLNKLGLIEIES